MASPEDGNPDFDQLDDLFSEDSLQADGLGDDANAFDAAPVSSKKRGKKAKRPKNSRKKREKSLKVKGASRPAFVVADLTSVYSIILMIALAAICVAVLSLCLELASYNWDRKATTAMRSGTALQTQSVATTLTASDPVS